MFPHFGVQYSDDYGIYFNDYGILFRPFWYFISTIMVFYFDHKGIFLTVTVFFQIRIHFDQRHLSYYTEIDAVALLGKGTFINRQSPIFSSVTKNYFS